MREHAIRTGAEYRSEHTLSDGTRVIVRPIRADDAAELRRVFARLSPSSKYRRFFGGVSELSEETLRYLTEVDGDRHVAFVAGVESPDLKSESGLGVGRFIRMADDPAVAEAAVTVVDDSQRKGLGRILLMTLAEAARERGVERFRADVLATNEPMRKILEEVGAVAVKTDETDGAITFDVPLSVPAGPGHDASASANANADANDGDDVGAIASTTPNEGTLARLLREAASSMAILVRRVRPPPPPAR